MIVAPFAAVWRRVARAFARGPVVMSTGRAQTTRGARYGKQLCSHLGRRVTSRWDADSGSGTIEFDGTSRVTLSTSEWTLTLTLTCPEHRLDELQGVLERHLVRFAGHDDLDIVWETHRP